jgi:hypothetical protein
MCSCGKMTASLPRISDASTSQPDGGAVSFEYIGRTSLTAIGRITGRRYRFGMPGTRVAVDLRDRHSLLSVPHLRQLRSGI